MRTRLRLAGALLAAAAASCGRTGPLGQCLHSDCRAVDSYHANVRLCEFPLSQFESSSDFSRSFIRQGQRIPLQLTGKLELVRTIEWYVTPRLATGNPPVARLMPTSRTTAVLEGVAPGGGGPTEDLFVGVSLTFADGTEGGASAAYCRGDDWIPANRIVVTP